MRSSARRKCSRSLCVFSRSSKQRLHRWVIPESFRSGRRPEGGEWSWRGKTPLWVEAKAGDTLLFRSEVRAPLKPFFSAAESDVRCCVRCGTAAGRMPPRTGTATSARLCTALAKWPRNSGRIPASSWRRRRATRPRIASSGCLASTLSPTTAKKLCPRRPHYSASCERCPVFVTHNFCIASHNATRPPQNAHTATSIDDHLLIEMSAQPVHKREGQRRGSACAHCALQSGRTLPDLVALLLVHPPVEHPLPRRQVGVDLNHVHWWRFSFAG